MHEVGWTRIGSERARDPFGYRVVAAEMRLNRFGGRQAGIEVAPQTLQGLGVGMIGRTDKVRVEGVVVPDARPLIQIKQAPWIRERQVVRVVKHDDLR
jgi:hypothetical protein